MNVLKRLEKGTRQKFWKFSDCQAFTFLKTLLAAPALPSFLPFYCRVRAF